MDYCKKCGNCCNSIKVDFEKNLLYFDGIQELDADFRNMLIETDNIDGVSICKCKYLKNNLCTNPKKHIFCAIYPSHPFAFIPDDCDYRGIVFLRSEKIKQTIRKMKEEIIHYDALIESGVTKEDKNQYQKIINSHNSFIQRYSAYGSEDW